MRPCKEEGLAEECAGAGEEDEDESDGEETAEKSFVWENATRSNLQRLGHSKAGREERGPEGDREQSAVGSKMIASSGVAAAVASCSLHVGHDEGSEHRFEVDLPLTDFSFKLPFLDDSFFRIPPQLPDDARRPQLRVDVEEAGEPGDLLPLVDPVPGEPGCEVVQQEGDEQHRRPGRVGLVLQLLLRDFSKAS